MLHTLGTRPSRSAIQSMGIWVCDRSPVLHGSKRHIPIESDREGVYQLYGGGGHRWVSTVHERTVMHGNLWGLMFSVSVWNIFLFLFSFLNLILSLDSFSSVSFPPLLFFSLNFFILLPSSLHFQCHSLFPSISPFSPSLSLPTPLLLTLSLSFLIIISILIIVFQLVE